MHASSSAAANFSRSFPAAAAASRIFRSVAVIGLGLFPLREFDLAGFGLYLAGLGDAQKFALIDPA